MTTKLAMDMTDEEFNLNLGIESFSEEAAEGEPVPEAVEFTDSESSVIDITAQDGELEASVERYMVLIDALESIGTRMHMGELSENSKVLLTNINHALPYALGVEAHDVGIVSGGISISAIIGAIWRAIKAVLKTIMDNFGALRKVLSGGTGALIHALEQNALFVSKIQGASHSGDAIELGSMGKYLAIDSADTLSSSQALLTAAESLMNLCNVVFKEYSGQLVNVGTGVFNAVSGTNLNNPEEGLEAAMQLVSKYSAAPLLTSTGASLPLFGGVENHPVGIITQRLKFTPGITARNNRDTLISEPILGDFNLYVMEPTIQQRKGTLPSVTERATLRQNTYVEAFPYKVVQRSGVEKPLSFTARLSPSEIAKLSNLAINMLKAINHFNDSGIAKRLDNTQRALERLSETMSKKVIDMAEFTPEAIAAYKATLEYNVAFARWTTKPMGNLSIHVVNVCRAIANLTNKSINCYLK